MKFEFLQRLTTVLFCLLLLAAASLWAQESEDDVELLSLAALLIGDGNYERAQQVLAGVDLDDEQTDLIRYHTLAGLVALNLNELPRAVSEFEAAIAAGQTESVVWLYLAQAHFGQQQYAQTLNALNQAGAQATQLPSVYMMRSQAHWEMGEYENAWTVLGNGRLQFPDRANEFARRQVFLLVDQGLYQEAAEQGRQFLETQAAGTDDAIAIGNALRQSGQLEEAANILELSRLTAPDNTTLAKVLSHTYIDQDMLLPAADVMRQASIYDSELVAEAA
ncbi:MAG: tetratricopeptide repeat protein, partial [Pseudomonadota bacterium]